MKKLRRTSFSKQIWYTLQYFVGFENSNDGHWEDVFNDEYKIEDVDSAMDKAEQICKKLHPITVRVINYEVTTETTEIAEFHSDKYHNK